MVSLLSLLVPILLSAVAVFIASSVIHMLLGYHAGDYGPVPDEAAVRSGLRLPPGDYSVPYAGSMEAMKSPEYNRKMEEGPVAILTVLPSGPTRMGGTLAGWFVYCVVVSIFAAYIASRALEPGAHYLDVFRFAGATAFASYVLGQWPQTIWYGKSMAATLRNTFDGLIYALLTAGIFGWLWPAA